MLFPELKQKKFGYVNVNAAAEHWLKRQGISKDEPNPLLDPVICEQMLLELHDELGIDFSFGGWLEDRGDIWRGSYLDQEEKYLHLGVDFTVPAGTKVAAEQAGEILRIDSDVPEEGGWGTRVILKTSQHQEVVLYAHLDPATSCRVGDRVEAGDEFAKVGVSPDNGGWFSHLHVQMVDAGHFTELEQNDLRTLDGYGQAKDRALLSRRYKDPLQFVFMP